ncbi:3-phosphoshikimate 1-carboxyvinyltransferase [Luteimicrobium sp. DT211]|uniref:3-phosphoshikimate 1-carboxyvinyltransferase n=1 Tax=Luteimicrobium sp. DT211 TaxID=3393412 RepID=UPI003CF973FD
MQLRVAGTGDAVVGELEVPVSKYHAHRALVLASLAPGRSVVTGVSGTRQVEWTTGVLRALGTRIEIVGDDYVVDGGPYSTKGAGDLVDHGSRAADGVLDVGSSGTTLYFLTGLASLADRPVTLTGMKYFRRRPIKALLDALRELGVELESDADRPPITVQPRRPRGGEAHIAGTLSQWLSGLLLLAPFAERDTTIHVTGGTLNERPYVELTVRMMRHFGLVVEPDDDWLTFRVPANQTATPARYELPPDIGSAAFGIAAAAAHPSDVLLRGLRATRAADTDHPEADFLDLAAAMGVPFERDLATGFVRVRHDGSPLRPVDVDCGPIPDLLPVLSAMASFAEGTSRFRNAGHVRLKESDRVGAMLQLGRLGADAGLVRGDELHVTGGRRLRGAPLSSFNDHRVLMALSVAATRAEGVSTLTYPHAYRISYPEFLEAMTSVGLDLSVVDSAQAASEVEDWAPVAATDDVSEAEAGALGAPAGSDDGALVLPDRVRELARTRPEATAVVEVGPDGPVATTWRELQDEADRVAALLLDLGVTRGEPVALQLPNWREFVAIALGVMQVGGVVTPIMPVFGPRETSMTLQRSRARVVFLPTSYRRRRPPLELLEAAGEARAAGRPVSVEHVVVLRTEARRAPGARVGEPPLPVEAAESRQAQEWTWRYYHAALTSVGEGAAARVEAEGRVVGPDDGCQLLFTSGTTGEPKGVQHRHRTLARATSMEVAHLGLGDGDRVYVPSPLAHQTGFLYGMLLAWRLGVAAVIQPDWDAQVALDQVFGARPDAGRATFVQAATPFLTDLVAAVEAGAPQPSTLRVFVPTGAAVPRALARRASEVLGSAMLGAFGTTETCLGTLAAPGDRPEDAWGTDGRPLPGIRIRIVDDEGRELPAGADGNYELHSPTMFDGYLDRPDLTADVFTADGWYRTGDLAHVDEHGFLHITGRVKDVINRGGEKVPVVEVENLLYQHPLVADVAIVAMPDARLGERACAFVVPARPGERLGFASMQKYLEAAGLSKYYWPERLEVVDVLPRNAVGKIQKNVLRERASALVDADTEGGRA